MFKFENHWSIGTQKKTRVIRCSVINKRLRSLREKKNKSRREVVLQWQALQHKLFFEQIDYP